MEIVLAFVIGGLYAAAVYMLLRRSLVKMLIGLALLSHAVNLLIFTVGRLTPGRPPIISLGAEDLASPYADPLPQALIVTSIVISFGVTAFALALAYRTYRTTDTDDLDQLRASDNGEGR